MSGFFHKAAVVACITGGVAVFLTHWEDIKQYLRPLSEAEIKLRANHKYWDQVTATTNVCTNWPASSNGVYSEIPKKLLEIPTKNVDPDSVMAVHKYLAPGVARLSNFNEMKTELPLKWIITAGAVVVTLGQSEVADVADIADGVDAVDAAESLDAFANATDTADSLDNIGTAADVFEDIANVAELANLPQATQLASVADKMDMAGGLEAIAGQVPSRGFLAFGSTIRYLKEKKRIPAINHLVA